eukprot:2336620-Rhodomonas_salina.1
MSAFAVQNVRSECGISFDFAGAREHLESEREGSSLGLIRDVSTGHRVADTLGQYRISRRERVGR